MNDAPEWTSAERAAFMKTWRQTRGLSWWMRAYERLRIVRLDLVMLTRRHLR